MGWRSASAVTLAILVAASLGSRNPAAAQSPPPFDMNAPAATPAPAAPVFTAEELRGLLAPFALYPDDLLAQLLPACAYPIEIVQVARWLEKNKEAVAKGDFAGIDAQSWDPSVKALARFPDIIAKLNADLDATSDIGDAFVSQPKDVADAIQFLRAQAQKSGALASTPQQTVTVEKQGETNYIVIEPAEPGVIYVPTYNPAVVYDPGLSSLGAGLIGFGVGVAVGSVIDDAWDWGRGWVYPPRWPGYPGYRPGRYGNNVNIGNDITIGGGNTRPWRPDPDRYRPGQGSKPGLATPGTRPGTAGRPGQAGNMAGNLGDMNRPAAGQRPNAGGLPARPDVGRPDAGQRPAAGRPSTPAQPPRSAAAKPGAKPTAKPAQRPKSPAASRPAPKAPPRPTAFSDVRAGGNAHGYSQRGATSRKSAARPPVPRGGGRHGGGGGRRR